MYAIIAERGTFQLLSLPGSAYAVVEGEYGKVFNTHKVAHENWFEGYNFLLELYDKHQKGTGHGGRKKRSNQLPKLDSRVLYHLTGSGGGDQGDGKGPEPLHGAEQHRRHEVPQATLV